MLNSKLKFNVLQDYVQQFDAVCLTETKYNATCIVENKIVGFESVNMSKKLKRHKYGSIHGICVLIKERISHHCTIIDNIVS